MAKSVPQPRLRAAWGKRFSLRMLFFVSVVMAVPFLLVANVLHNLRPGDTVGSPLYLLLGVGGVVLAAAIGSAVGGRAGLFTAATVAAFCWVALVVLCGIFSSEMQAVLPIHVLGSLTTVAVLAVLVWKYKQPEHEDTHDMLLKLLKVKHDVQDSQQARHQDSVSADSSIENLKSNIQN